MPPRKPATRTAKRASKSAPWAQFELLVAHLSDGVTVQDAKGRLVYANEAGARLSGYSTAAELLAAPVGDFLHRYEVLTTNNDPMPLEKLPGRVAMNGTPGEALLLVRDRVTGEERWSEVRSYPVPDADGGVKFVVNIFRDTTEAVRQRQRLEDQADELEQQTLEAQALAEELEQSNHELAESLHIVEESERREQYLSRATVILGSSLDYNDTIQRVAQLTVPELADWCSVDLLEPDGTIRQLAVAHVDPQKVKWARELRMKQPPDMNASTGLPNVLRTGRPELHARITDELLRRTATAEQMAVIREIGLSSALIVPLRAQTTVGALTMVWAETGKHYTEDDLDFAVELGRRAAVAIERATLHREALAARAEAERARAISDERSALLDRLLQLATALSRAISTADILAVATTMGRQAFDADTAHLAFLDESRENLELIGAEGLTEDIARRYQRIPIDAPVPSAECVRSSKPVLVENDEAFARRFPGLADARRQVGARATAAVPIRVARTVVGALILTYRRDRQFDEQYVGAARTFAKEIGQAWDRARARTELARAKSTADAANAAKSIFLATMTHELRTPINAILGFAELMQLGVAGKTTPSQDDYLKRIRNSTEHLLELINDILDLSKIESGQFELNPQRSSAADVIHEAVDLVVDDAQSRGLTLESTCEAGSYNGDPRRVRQILLNLLSNAIKFTAPGGSVKLVCTADTMVRFAVEDSGIGIKPEDMSRIFEAFSQGEQVYTREHGGTGLGLTISRRLARMMDGDVTVESTFGKGSRFTLSLPEGR